MAHDINPEWDHVYDWLELPPLDEGERQAKEWFNEFTKPACVKDHTYLDSHMLMCVYEGGIYRVTGASRLGDVWLNGNFNPTGYDKRVNVAHCSTWKLVLCDNSVSPSKITKSG